MRTTLSLDDAVLRILGHPRHRFWGTAPSLLDHLAVDTDQLLESGQITDALLLALAVHHRGVLATLDTRPNPRSVNQGTEALETLQPQTRP